ncbi:hypothetical protein ABBQ32_004175 [Trebouxia sp. C0010 RCD-2024]
MSACLTNVEDTPTFCVPTEKIFRPGCSWQHSTCYNGECEGLHVPAEERAEQASWPKPLHQKVIITAGPERSGSTWLFNAVRLLLKSAHTPYDPYWVTTLTTHKVNQRKMRADGNHVVIKTHQWSDAWQVQQADHILLTHRDLQGVVASYRRVGWAFNISASYVEEHQQWRDVAEIDVAYENIMAEPTLQLQMLADALGVNAKVDIAEVNRELQSLKPAQSGAPDPVSKLWPGHHSAAVQRQQEEGCTPLSDAEEKAETPNARLPSQNAQLKKQFPQFYAQYGYD